MDSNARNEYKKDTVDVVIPFHRMDNYLSEAISSVKLSIGVDVRLIVVNDTGNKISADYLKLRESDLLIDSSAKGYVNALQTGILNSTAEFVAFLDSDDIMEPHRLSMQIAKIKITGTDFISGQIVKFTHNPIDGHSFSILGPIPKTSNPELLLLLGSHGADSSILAIGESIRKSWNIHSTFPPSVADFGWLLKCLSDGSLMSHEPAAIYFYRSHRNQLSRSGELGLEWNSVYPYWFTFCKNRLNFLSRFNASPLTRNVALSLVFPSAMPKLNRNELHELKVTILNLIDDIEELNIEDSKAWKKTLWYRYLIASRLRSVSGISYFPSLIFGILKAVLLGLFIRNNA